MTGLAASLVSDTLELERNRFRKIAMYFSSASNTAAVIVVVIIS